MSDKDAAMQQALDALLDLQSLDSQDVWLDRWSEAITALKAALEQPEQEPTPWRDMIVVTLVREGINKHKARELADHFAAQPVQEPIGEVVEANNDGFKCEFSQHLPVGTKLYTTPPLPVQEPVGDEWTPCMKLPVVVHVRQQRPDEAHVSTREGITPVKPDDLIMRGVSGEEYPIGRAIFEQTYSLNTTPPAVERPWVALTEQDMPSGEDLMFDHRYFIAGLVYAAKVLKEKNT